MLHQPSEKAPKFPIDGDSLDAQLKSYVETPLKPAAAAPVVKAVEAEPAKLAIHHGDLLLATDRQAEASRYYNADSKDARAARAILTRFTRPPAEAIRILERTAREVPDNGLVQYPVGRMETQDAKDLQSQAAASERESQAAALERATQLLPRMGRAYAELARVYALTGRADKGLPLIAKAMDLEPEYADRFYEI